MLTPKKKSAPPPPKPAARAEPPKAPPQPARPAVVTSEDVAVRLVAKIDQSMASLMDLIVEETALVRAGRLRAASELGPAKEEHAGVYMRLMLVARDEIAALKAFAPAETAALIERHQRFRAETQVNLAVLNTAKDVAEDLMRTVASEVGMAATAPTYGRPGTPPAAISASARGIAVNQSC